MNPITVSSRPDLLEIDLLCRTCLTLSNNLKSLFIDENDGNDIHEMLQSCSGLNIYARDGMPASICLDCLNKLRIAYDFRRQCNTSHNTLVDFMKTKTDCNSSKQNKSPPALLEVHIKSEYTVEISDPINEEVLEKEKFDAKNIKTERDELEYLICTAPSVPIINFKVDYESKMEESSNVSSLGDEREIFDEVADPLSDSQIDQDGPLAESHNKGVHLHYCDQCDKKYSVLKNLRRHQLSHSEINPYSCEQCDKTFSSLDNKNIHIQRKHSKIKHHQCDKCEKTFAKPYNFRRHREICGRKLKPWLQICEICQKTFTSLKSLNIHLKTHETAEIQDFTSNQEHSDHLEAHSKDIANQETAEVEEWTCTFCPQKFTSKQEHSDHLKTHSKNIPKQETAEAEEWTCTFCPQKFISKQEQSNHLETHSKNIRNQETAEVAEWTCITCSKKFNSKQEHSDHLKTHSKEKPYKCDDCDSTFNWLSSWKRHRQNCWRIVRFPAKICDVCKQSFTSIKKLKSHRKVHRTNGYECYFCTKGFKSMEERADHMKAHEKELLFLCCECGLRFGRKGDLASHMLRHSGEKKYECKYCGKRFPRASALTMHERYHTGEKKYQCTICGKSFPRSYSLLIHNRVHTGERPFKCTQCDKSFAQKNDLTAHIRRHTGERFKCDLCDNGFIHSSLLSQHKRKKHGVHFKSQRLEKIFPKPTKVLNSE